MLLKTLVALRFCRVTCAVRWVVAREAEPTRAGRILTRRTLDVNVAASSYTPL